MRVIAITVKVMKHPWDECVCTVQRWGCIAQYNQINSFHILGMTNAEVLNQVEHGYRMQCPPGCPPTLYDIMLECWHKDPMKRPTFETLQWQLEDFFTLSDSEYKEAGNY